MTLRRSVGSGFAMMALGFGLGVLAASPTFAQGNPERNVYFGQTHVHTSWSFDAYVFGNTVTGPEDAYKYALGEPIKHPGGYMVQLKRQLDFQAVTDHAEYVGTVRLANDPTSELSKLPIADKLKVQQPRKTSRRSTSFSAPPNHQRADQGAPVIRKWRAASGNKPSRSPTNIINRESSRPLPAMNGPRHRTTATCIAT